MFKYFEIELGSLASDVMVERIIASNVMKYFEIPAEEVLVKIHQREALGSTQITPNFKLPHIEHQGILNGLLLVHYQLNDQEDRAIYTQLCMVINSNNVNQELQGFLEYILTIDGINKLRNCRDQACFAKLINEGTNV